VSLIERISFQRKSARRSVIEIGAGFHSAADCEKEAAAAQIVVSCHAMKRFSVSAAVLVTLIQLTLSISGCAPKTPEETNTGPDASAVDMSVPPQIRDQLLSAEDIRGRATLKSETIEVDATQKRLLISGEGPFLCSPTGNCPYWIFRQTLAGYEMEIDLDVAQEVTIETGKTKFPGVLARQHGSATDSELRLYQFDGTAIA
jgi:hypothetical protein